MTVGRNDKCPCGSGKKFKKCHLPLIEARAQGSRSVRGLAEIPTYEHLPAITAVTDIGPFLDAAVSGLAIFRRPRIEATLHVLRLVQTLYSVNDVRAAMRGRFRANELGLRASQDLLRWLMYKVFTINPSGGTVRPSTKEDVDEAATAVGVFLSYSTIQDGILVSQAGQSDCRVDRASKTIRFQYTEPDREARLATRLVREAREREAARQRVADSTSPTMVEAVRRTIGAATIDGELGLTYEPTPELIDAVRAQVAPEMPPPLLPSTCSLGPYSLGQFRAFTEQLVVRSTIHELMLAAAAMTLKGTWGPHNGAALLLTVPSIIDWMRVHAALDPGVSAEILRDLTYAPDRVRWVDVLYQPMIPLDGDQLATIPILIGASNYERNLLALVDRLPWRKEGSVNLKGIREGLMFDQIEAVTRAAGVVSKRRLGLGPKTAPLGDIDLLLWNRQATVALALSLKWFYGADSMREVLNHDDWFRKGIATHIELVKALSESPEEVSARHRLEPPLTKSTVVRGLLVSHEAKPTEWVDTEGLIVVSMREFLDAFRKCDGDLETCERALHQPAESLSEETRISRKVEAVELGGYKFEIPMITY